MHNRTVVLILIALAVSGWGGVQLGGGVEAAGGGPAGVTVALYDDMADDSDAGYEGWGTSTTCTWVDTTPNVLEIINTGVCHPLESGEFSNPTDHDQWALVRFNAETADNYQTYRGPALRLESDAAGAPTDQEFNYVMRCNGSFIELRSCHTSSSCTTFHLTSIACVDGAGMADDTHGFAVAGTGSATEWCVWFWDTGGPTMASQDIDNWGPADECVSDDAITTGDPMLLLSAYEDCEGADTTLCKTRTGGTPNYADDTGNTDVGLYSGTDSGTGRFAEWQAGNLGL